MGVKEHICKSHQEGGPQLVPYWDQSDTLTSGEGAAVAVRGDLQAVRTCNANQCSQPAVTGKSAATAVVPT